jgi:NAD(P)H-hydrate epimerase
MRTADRNAITKYSIPGVILMENAARSSAEYVIEIVDELGYNNQNPCNDPLIDIICGSGNNGGDGFALARHLHELFRIRVFWIGDEKKMSRETLSNYKAVQKLNIEIKQITSNKDLKRIHFSEDCIIDSMIGVGGSEEIKGIALDILKKLKTSRALKIAIDVPTGLNSENGKVSPWCFEADFTITMYAEKMGMIINDGPDVCGRVLIAYLGAPLNIIERISKTHILEDNDVRGFLPERQRRSSKFDYGKVMVIAGSKKYPGAGALTSNAVITSGAGLVYLCSTAFHSALLPEVIPINLESTGTGAISKKSSDDLMKELDKAEVIAIGPGLSDNVETLELVTKIIKNYIDKKYIVIDADGLRSISKQSKLSKKVILTPHCGEFSRIIGIPRKEIELNSLELAKQWAKKLNCIIVLKHIPVIITDGETVFVNVTGNPGMATGGSGDVLTGMIAGLMGQGLEPLMAGALGVFIHSKAGDIYAEKYSQETLTASRLIDFIPEVMAENVR